MACAQRSGVVKGAPKSRGSRSRTFQERFWGGSMNFRRRRVDGPGEAAKSRRLLATKGLDDLTVSHL
jgi:hypothetical protein